MGLLFEKNVLSRSIAAARSDVPSEGDLVRSLGVLSSTNPSCPPAASGAGSGTVASGAAVSKGMLVSACVASIAGGALLSSFDDPLPTSPPTTSRTVPSVTTESPAPDPVEELDDIPTITLDDLIEEPESNSPDEGEHRNASSESPPKMRDAGSERKTSIEAEAELIESAWLALPTNPGHALDLVTRHREGFSDGVLGVERSAIAIEALARLGRRAEACRALVEFESHHPSSVYLSHLKKFCLSERTESVTTTPTHGH